MRPAFLTRTSVSHSFAKLYERVKAAHTVVFFCDHGHRSPARATKCVVLYCLWRRFFAGVPLDVLHDFQTEDLKVVTGNCLQCIACCAAVHSVYDVFLI
jgi:hypothetical protein